MQENKWEKEMPEIPDHVHNAVLCALDTLNTENVKGDGGHMMKHKSVRRAGLVAVLAAAMVGTTAFAAELIWNNKTVEEFHNPPMELQQKTVDNGVAVLPNVSVTDSGVTVTAVQMLQDENRVYIMLRVESEEAVIDGNSLFDRMELYDGENHNIFNNIGAQFIDEEDGKLTNDGYYVIDALKDSVTGWNGTTLEVALSGLSYYQYENGGAASGGKKIEGNWKLELALTDASALSKTVELGKDIHCGDVPVTVNYVKISPLSIVISYDAADVEKIKVAEDDFIPELLSAKLLDKQGNELLKTGYGAMSSWNTEDGQYVVQMGLIGVVDMEQADQIELGGGTLTAKIQ